jgi:hypothetical protein
MEWSSYAIARLASRSEALHAMVKHGANGFRLNAAKPDVFEECLQAPIPCCRVLGKPPAIDYWALRPQPVANL